MLKQYTITYKDWQLGDKEFTKIIFAKSLKEMKRKFYATVNNSADIIDYKTDLP